MLVLREGFIKCELGLFEGSWLTSTLAALTWLLLRDEEDE